MAILFWSLVDTPPNSNLVGSKWVYKVKVQGQQTIYKARLVAKGCSHVEGINSHDTFAPVVRLTTFSLLFSIAAVQDWKIYHFDIISDFLQGNLEEVFYLKQPQFFLKLENEHKVYRLKNVIYGLRQGSDAWNNLFPVSKCFGINVTRDRARRTTYLDQSEYAQSILTNFNMNDCQVNSTPMEEGTNGAVLKTPGMDEEYLYRSLVGTLIYLYQATRPDLTFAVNILSRFNNCYKAEHWQAAERVLRCLKASTGMKLVYGPNRNYVVGYSDAGCPKVPIDDPKFTPTVFLSCGGPISWTTSEESTVACSSTEAKYYALLATTKGAIWLHDLCLELRVGARSPINIHCDNKSIIQFIINENYSKETQHINLQHHFIKRYVSDKCITLEFTSTTQMLGEGLTKDLSKAKFE